MKWQNFTKFANIIRTFSVLILQSIFFLITVFYKAIRMSIRSTINLFTYFFFDLAFEQEEKIMHFHRI